MTGCVTLEGDLQVSLLNAFAPALESKFFIIVNDGADDVSGMFARYAQGSTFSFGPHDFMVSYIGDWDSGSFTGGNDVLLQSVPEPGAVDLLALAALMQIVIRRRLTVKIRR